MSRSYLIEVEVEGIPPERKEAVVAALCEIGGVSTDSWAVGDTFTASTHDDIALGGGVGTDEASHEFAKDIFRAAGCPVEVTIRWWYRDRDPDETEFFGEDDYNKMIPPLEQLAGAAED